VDFAQIALGNLIGVLAVVVVVAGVMKIFQIASTLHEVKELLGDIKRNMDHTPQGPYTQSGDEMLRALSDAHEPSVQREILTRPLAPPR
jgi:hypothetical protein